MYISMWIFEWINLWWLVNDNWLIVKLFGYLDEYVYDNVNNYYCDKWMFIGY